MRPFHAKAAGSELVACTVGDMQGKYPKAPVFIMGDFNSRRLNGVLPSFHQYKEG